MAYFRITTDVVRLQIAACVALFLSASFPLTEASIPGPDLLTALVEDLETHGVDLQKLGVHVRGSVRVPSCVCACVR